MLREDALVAQEISVSFVKLCKPLGMMAYRCPSVSCENGISQSRFMCEHGVENSGWLLTQLDQVIDT